MLAPTGTPVEMTAVNIDRIVKDQIGDEERGTQGE